MQQTLHIKTRVLPGHKIEVSDLALGVGEAVDVIISRPSADAGRQSALELLDSLPSGRLFNTSRATDQYITEERKWWER